jgi:hypothetical protein
MPTITLHIPTPITIKNEAVPGAHCPKPVSFNAQKVKGLRAGSLSRRLGLIEGRGHFREESC